MILSLITDDVALAGEAERAGIDRILIDLEREGKAQRQAGRSLFQSSHRIESVAPMKAALAGASLVVRINPLSERTPRELDDVIAAGADVVMLPYFRRPSEVRAFGQLVEGRCRISLLVETCGAAGHLSECLAAGPVHEVHIGLNDLSIDLGCAVVFEPLCTGLIDQLAATLRAARIPFGVGGLARLSAGALPVSPERLLAEQVRLGCSRAWLGRTFREGLRGTRLAEEAAAIREAAARWRVASEEALAGNRRRLVEEIARWKGTLAQGV